VKKCPTCSGHLVLEAWSYLSTPAGGVAGREGATVPGAIDTGLKINVEYCARCSWVWFIPGARPFLPPVMVP
jgi:hypothetical protein